MQINELITHIQGTLLTQIENPQQVQCAYTCDLLSWVMAKGQAGCAWITVQTHINVIAVAVLHDMACVICPEGIAMQEESIKKAQEEGIAVISSPLTAYSICGILHQLGIPSV